MFHAPPPASLPIWQEQGFACPPTLCRDAEGLVVYRVTGFTSKNPFGNCFFAPARPGVDPAAMTAHEMDLNLNCAIWGNGYQTLRAYRLHPDTTYWRGPIAQAGWVGRRGEYSRFVPPSNRPVRGDLEQVVLVEVRHGTPEVLGHAAVPARLTLLREYPVWGSIYFHDEGPAPRDGGAVH